MRLSTLLRRLFGRPEPLPPEGVVGLGTAAIYRAVLRSIESAAPNNVTGDYLDVGSGAGDVLKTIRERYAVNVSACDYTSKLMMVPGQHVDIVDLNREPLPYAADRFALVTCSETIEHLENFRETVRELFRVLQPGGIAVISTPNVLNFRSRLHYLSFGFPSLFGPVLAGDPNIHDVGGHISPVPWPYLAHALQQTGFVDLALSIDKYQRRSLWVLLVLLFVQASGWWTYWRTLRKSSCINDSNDWIVRKIFSFDILLGRTLVVSARKPQ